MGKIRNFWLRRPIKTIFRCISRQKMSPSGYGRLEPDWSFQDKPVSRLIEWTHKIRSKAKAISLKSKTLVPGRFKGNGYVQMGQDPVIDEKRPVKVPKGYMAVYVGLKDGDFERVLVPVIYFNHPLFARLLLEAEEVFGFDYPGAIQIPCRISEFEHVQTQIKGRVIQKLLTWKLQIAAMTQY